MKFDQLGKYLSGSSKLKKWVGAPERCAAAAAAARTGEVRNISVETCVHRVE